MTAHLDAGLLKNVDLPPLPGRFRTAARDAIESGRRTIGGGSYPIQTSIKEGKRTRHGLGTTSESRG